MSSIMDLFKTEAPNKTDAKTPASKVASKENLSDSAPTVGADGKMPGTAPTDENPLDIYKTMFDNAASSSTIQAPEFSLDPKVLSDVSKKMDFTRGITPDLMQKATSGDITALMDVIKTVGQNSYRAAIEHGTALTDTHLKQRGDFELSRVEKGVNKRLTESALSNSPNYSHPVVKSELNRIASQFAAANPDASPEQVAKAAQKYLQDLHSALNPSAGTDNKESSGEMDWTKYLSSNP